MREQAMTPRARLYLALSAARNAALGVLCLLAPSSFAHGSYSEITDLLSLSAWGVLFFVGAIHLVAAAYWGRERWARIALTISAALAMSWAVSFLLAAMDGQLTGWAAPVLWMSVAASDLVVTRQPLRTPFEDLVDKLADGG